MSKFLNIKTLIKWIGLSLILILLILAIKDFIYFQKITKVGNEVSFARNFNPIDKIPTQLYTLCNALVNITCYNGIIHLSPLFPYLPLQIIQAEDALCLQKHIYQDPLWKVFWVQTENCQVNPNSTFGPFRN